MNPTEPPMKALCICHISFRERQDVLAIQMPSTSALKTATTQLALAIFICLLHRYLNSLIS